MVNIKEEARRLIDRLPENATWDDLMHEIYVRKSIMEDVTLTRAIQEGETSEPVSREEIFRLLDSGA